MRRHVALLAAGFFMAKAIDQGIARAKRQAYLEWVASLPTTKR